MFEVWADVARHYRLDPGWTAIAGYSMGGYGAYKLVGAVPGPVRARAHDRRAAGHRDSRDTRPLLASLRNLPILIWAAGADELVPIEGPRDVADRLDDARLPLRVRRVPGGSPPAARVQRPVPARRRLPRRGARRARPGARVLRLQPGDGLPARRDGRGPRVLGVARARCATRRPTAGSAWSTCARRASASATRRRPGVDDRLQLPRPAECSPPCPTTGAGRRGAPRRPRRSRTASSCDARNVSCRHDRPAPRAGRAAGRR